MVTAEAGFERQLARMAAFRRKGRVPSGQLRLVVLVRKDKGRLILPRGLLWRVQRVAGRNIVVEDRRLRFAPRPYRWTGRLYTYQQAAVQTVYRQQGGVLVSAPGSGKTVMGLALVAAWGQPTLWLTHTTRLAEQALEQAHRLFDLPQSAYGSIGEGAYSVGLFTVAMIQTLGKRPDIVRYLAPRIGTVVVDEAHHAPADTYLRIISRFPAAYRLGLSATPDRTDGLGPAMVAVLGGRVMVPLQVLLAAGRVMRPRVLIARSAFRVSAQNLGWAELERLRARDPHRNGLIVELVRRFYANRRKTLVLVTRKDHARILAKALVSVGIPAYAVIGELTPERRDRYLAAMENGRAVCVATRLADEGLDLPALDTLILASAARSPVQLDQQIGRVMRAMPGKPVPIVVDIADSHVHTYAKQARKRAQHYERLGLEVGLLRLQATSQTQASLSRNKAVDR